MKTIKTIIEELRGALRRLVAVAAVGAVAICATAVLPGNAQAQTVPPIYVTPFPIPSTAVTNLNLSTNSVGGTWITPPQGQDFFVALTAWPTNGNTGASSSGSNITVTVDATLDTAGILTTNLASGAIIANAVASNFLSFSATIQGYTNTTFFFVARTNVTGIKKWRVGRQGSNANTNIEYSLSQSGL